MITSYANKKIKNIEALLTKGKERKKQELFVVEGVKMFMEAPFSWMRDIYIEETLYFDYLEGRADADFSRRLKQILNIEDAESEFLKTDDEPIYHKKHQEYPICFEIVAEDVFCKMSDTQTPQGILCVMKKPEYTFDEVGKQSDGPKLYLILEDIQDPGNLGTILRAGEGAGIDGVILSGQCVDLFNPKTVRATMGSIYRVPFYYAADIKETILQMKKAGITVYAAHLKGKSAYDAFDYRKSVAFLIGNESNGLREETARMADDFLRIPMLGQVESLNAAIASSLLMYEAARQRRN